MPVSMPVPARVFQTRAIHYIHIGMGPWSGAWQLCASCSHCHAALGSDGAAFTVNQNCTTPRARPRPVARKCSQDTRRGVFHRLFPNHSDFFYTVRYQKHFSCTLFTSPTGRKRSFINIVIFGNKNNTWNKWGSLLWAMIERASEEICHFQRNCHLTSTSGASFHAN